MFADKVMPVKDTNYVFYPEEIHGTTDLYSVIRNGRREIRKDSSIIVKNCSYISLTCNCQEVAFLLQPNGWAS